MFFGAIVGLVIAGSMPVGWDARRLKALPFLAAAIFIDLQYFEQKAQ
jgi:hypothetical protein